MTLVADKPGSATQVPQTRRAIEARLASPPPAEMSAVEPARYGRLALLWFAIAVVSMAVVSVTLGPIDEDREQRALLGTYSAQIDAATKQAFGLAGIEVATEAPATGAPVAVIDIERTGLSRVVVEGTDALRTRQGPGHVVGTGGPGQPGNSVIVGRRSLFGGAFATIGDLEVGDRILVTTVQGRTVYRVDHVGTHTIGDDDPAAGTGVQSAVDAQPVPALPDGPVTAAQVYGASTDDRLTLVTSASGVPGATGDAEIVVARMEGVALPPTPQGQLVAASEGRSGNTGHVWILLLAILAFAAASAGVVWVNRKLPWRSAYLLSIPVLLALSVVLADALAAMLPAWA